MEKLHYKFVLNSDVIKYAAVDVFAIAERQAIDAIHDLANIHKMHIVVEPKQKYVREAAYVGDGLVWRDRGDFPPDMVVMTEYTYEALAFRLFHTNTKDED